jgi:hypothetical protein
MGIRGINGKEHEGENPFRAIMDEDEQIQDEDGEGSGG